MRAKTVPWLIAALTAGILVGSPPGPASAASPSSTSALGQGPAFDGYAPGLPDRGPLGLRWRRDLDGAAVGGPDGIYVLRHGIELSSVSWETGLRRWRQVRRGTDWDDTSPSPSAIATDGAMVVVVSGNEIYARDAQDGTLRWSVAVPESDPDDWSREVTSPRLTVADGVVVVQVLDGVQAFAVADGARLWARQEDEGSEPSFAVDGQTVVVTAGGPRDCSMAAVDLQAGTVRWSLRGLPDASCAWGAPAAHQGTVRWGDVRSVIDGAVVPGTVANPGTDAVFAAGTAFSTAFDGPGRFVTAAEPDGRVSWRHPVEQAGEAPAAVGPRSVLTSGPDPTDPTARTHSLRLLDRTTGAPLGTSLRSEAGASRSSVVVGDGVILAGGSVVAPDASPVTFPGRRVRFAGGGVQPEPPKDEFSTWIRTARPAVPFRAPAGSSPQCRADDGPWVACTSPWSTPDLGPDGDHVVAVRHDVTAPVARLVLDLDRVAPTMVVTGGATGTVRDADRPFPPFELVTDDPLASVWCAVDDEDPQPCGSRARIGPESGEHVLRVYAEDENGNRSAVVERRWYLDAGGPRLTISPVTGPVRSAAVTLPFTVSDDATLVLCSVVEKLPGGELRTASPEARCSGAWSGTLADGSYRLVVDARGNDGRATVARLAFDVDLSTPDPDPGPGTGPGSDPDPGPGTDPGTGVGDPEPPAGGTDPVPSQTPPADPVVRPPSGDDAPPFDSRPPFTPVTVVPPDGGAPPKVLVRCAGTLASGARPPRVVSWSLRAGRVVARVRLRGPQSARAVLQLQVRTGCGPWRTVQRTRTRRGAARLVSGRVPPTVDAVRLRSRVGDRVATSASVARGRS